MLDRLIIGAGVRVPHSPQIYGTVGRVVRRKFVALVNVGSNPTQPPNNNNNNNNGL